MLSSSIRPEDFCRVGTRRVRAFAAAATAPLVAGAGWDGRVHVWNVQSKQRVLEFATSADRGGVSVALSPNGSACFVGTYYAWGAACVEIAEGRECWRRSDLKRFYGMASSPDGAMIIGWFNGRAGLTLDAGTGASVTRHVGLRKYCFSRFDGSHLKFARQFELSRPDGQRHQWAPESFALLTCAFSPQHCVVSESASAVNAIELTSGTRAWRYQPRVGAHVTGLDYSPRLRRFVALEYAYTEAARETGPMLALLHFDTRGNVVFRRSIREWPDAVFCADGELLLNGLGELLDTSTGELTYVFEFPR
jgi:hypothetical protein